MQLKLKLFCLTWLAISTAHAYNVTNNIQGPAHGKVNPYFCIQQSGQALAPGESIDTSADWVGGALRFGGCGEKDPYLGYIGFKIGKNYAFDQYHPEPGVHVTIRASEKDTQDGKANIDQSGHITGHITYTPITTNPQITNKKPRATAPFVGINLSGLEFSKTIDPYVIPNLSTEDAQYEARSDLKDTQAFLDAGMNTVRVPISWGFLQLNAPQKNAHHVTLNDEYYDAYVKPLLQSLTQSGVHTILDLHAYMRYSAYGKEFSGCSGIKGRPCPEGKLIDDVNAYATIWGDLYEKKIKSDPAIDKAFLMIDIMNEPVVNAPQVAEPLQYPGDLVLKAQIAVIKKLNDLKFNGYYLLEGNAWSGLHSWTTKHWKSQDGSDYTNATLFSREKLRQAIIAAEIVKDADTKQAAAKADAFIDQHIIINVHQYLDAGYEGNHGNDQHTPCLTDLTTEGENGFNLKAFVDYLQTNHLKAMVTEFGSDNAETNRGSCSAALNTFLSYIQTNAYTEDKKFGFLGWTIWSTGHGWGNYNLRITPTSYHMQVLEKYIPKN